MALKIICFLKKQRKTQKYINFINLFTVSKKFYQKSFAKNAKIIKILLLLGAYVEEVYRGGHIQPELYNEKETNFQ